MARIVDREDRRWEGIGFLLLRFVVRASASYRVYQDGRDEGGFLAVNFVAVNGLNFRFDKGYVVPIVDDLGARLAMRAGLIYVCWVFVVLV